MKFLIDAQIPISAAELLRDHGHDVLHTLDLPAGNRTPDHELSNCCQQQDRILITKDKDFLQSHIVNKRPAKLLLIKTGNINNTQLLKLLGSHLTLICQLFNEHAFIELHKEEIAVSRDE